MKILNTKTWMRYVIYSNTPPHTRALWARNVDATHALRVVEI